MSRYQTMFVELYERQEAALIPFLVIGDPDADEFLAHIDTVVRTGADALELGLPFSDPVADGPVVTAAGRRALAKSMNALRAFELVAEIRARYPSLPIGLLVYSNLVFAHGPDAFHARAAAAGVDSLLIADAPMREAQAFRAVAEMNNIAQVVILPPDADETTLRRVAATSQGYVYLQGRKGVTGSDRSAEIPLPQRLEALRRLGAAPAVIGFGVSRPEHVGNAVANGAAGVIVGSALVDAFARNEDVALMIRKLKAATRLNTHA